MSSGRPNVLVDIDAQSLVPSLRSPDAETLRRVAVCSQAHYRALRSTSHKYIANNNRHRFSRPDDPDEVYDLLADPGETRNLVVTDPTVAEEIRTELLALEQESRSHATRTV